MRTHEDRNRIISHLKGDVLRHIVTLKMLQLYGDAIEFRFVQGTGGWALLSLLPVVMSDFDRQTYPEAKFVVLVDGTSQASKLDLLENLPAGRLVIKSYDASVTRFALGRLGARKVRSFRSFTLPPAGPVEAAPAGVIESEALVPEIIQMFSHNGYLEAELAIHFAARARWYAIQDGVRKISAGFVFRNFDLVWEIGGLFTVPGFRRQGHARKIVAAALNHLVAQKLVPRYQVRADNLESIRLAESTGLQPFLQMDHLLTH